MNRLEKKCLIASAGTHALIFLLLFTAPLLFVSKKAPALSIPELTLIPSRLIDGPSQGGGNPNVQTLAPPAPAPAGPTITLAPPTPRASVAPPKPEPARPEPKPAKEETEMRPKRSRPKRMVMTEKVAPSREEPEESDDPNEVRIGNRKIHLSFQKARVKASSDRESTSNGESQAQADANARATAMARYAARVQSIAGAIGQGMSTGTAIDVPGPGGEAFGNYAAFIYSFYKNNWTPPPDMLKGNEVVTVRLVVARDGTVISFHIIRSSGRAALDTSVDRLKRIQKLAPFPEGATDSERAFVIRFNLKPEDE